MDDFPRPPFTPQQQPVPGEKFREIRIVVFTRNNLIHGIADGFQPLKLLNLMNHGGLIHIDVRAAAAQITDQVKKPEPGREPDHRYQQNNRKNRAQ